MSYIERIAQQCSSVVFSRAELAYYSRHLLLPSVGLLGQKKLKSARVLVVGAGGLGCPVLQGLAGAGVGSICIVDGDTVAASNRSRQWLHTAPSIGQNKAVSAKAALVALNPHIAIEAVPEMLDASNAAERIAACDLVIDATDALAVRYRIDAVCAELDRPWVHGALYRESAQIAVFWSRYGARFCDLFLEPSEAPDCSGAGMLGASASLVGHFQALEAIQLITGAGVPGIGSFCTVDTMTLRVDRFRVVEARPEPFEVPGGGPDPGAGAMSAVELKQRLSIHQAPAILDLREERAGGLPGAIACSEASLLEDGIPPLEADTILLVCEEGTVSAMLAGALRRIEPRVGYLAGGLRGWRGEGEL
jgi:adenylyltransferase/sulfurtransferase